MHARKSVPVTIIQRSDGRTNRTSGGTLRARWPGGYIVLNPGIRHDVVSQGKEQRRMAERSCPSPQTLSSRKLKARFTKGFPPVQIAGVNSNYYVIPLCRAKGGFECLQFMWCPSSGRSHWSVHMRYPVRCHYKFIQLEAKRAAIPAR